MKWCRERIELMWPGMIFPWCFPSGEILKFRFRVLTFPSACYDINQSNYMQSGCFEKIWSFLVISLWTGAIGARLAWLRRYVWVLQLDSLIHICRNHQLLFAVDYRIEIRLLWEIGGIWLKWCRERTEILWPGMILPWCFPSEEILNFHFRILTFPSVCYAIKQSNYVQSGYFQKIWSVLVQFVKWWSWSMIGLIAEVCLSDSVTFNYSHFRNHQLLFGVNHSIEIRLLWKIGDICVKSWRERSECFSKIWTFLVIRQRIFRIKVWHSWTFNLTPICNFVFMSVIVLSMTVNSKSASMPISYRHGSDKRNQFTSLRVNRFDS
jgi:hypothetical protein